MAQITLKNATGKKAGTVELDDATFGIQPNVPVMHQVVTAQLAARRAGTQSTKTRSEVRGGGAKPYRQKGTGNARQGSIRSPQFNGGGVALSNILNPSQDAGDSVSCEICHKIRDVDASANAAGFDGISVDISRPNNPLGSKQVMYGPLGDVSYLIPDAMYPSYRPEIRDETCAACHQYNSDPDNDTLNAALVKSRPRGARKRKLPEPSTPPPSDWPTTVARSCPRATSRSRRVQAKAPSE